MSKSGSADRFAELVQAGRVAMATNKRKEAHNLWKEAAGLDPYNEQIWLLLLDVIETDEDRRVCLQNILQINPMNVQARRQLSKIEARLQRVQVHHIEQKKSRRTRSRQKRSVVARAFLIGIAIGLSGVLFGIVISILFYGR